jgi:hypothetical protein
MAHEIGSIAREYGRIGQGGYGNVGTVGCGTSERSQALKKEKLSANCIKRPPDRIPCRVDVDLKEAKPMERRYPEVVGVRRTGWAALDRDPQEDRVEFVCPHCGKQGQKNARRERTQYHFTDGFLQDLQGEVTVCRGCAQSLRVVPIVMLHDQDETRRFEAVFSDDLAGSDGLADVEHKSAA